MTPEEQFEALWNDYLEGDLEPGGMAELNALLAAHPALQQRAADLFQTHRLLGFSLQDPEPQAEPFVQATLAHLPQAADAFVEEVMHRVTAPPPVRHRGRGRIVTWPLAAAAALGAAAMLILGVILLGPRETTIARVIGLSGPIQWTGDGGRLMEHVEIGTALGGGTLETLASDGWLELAFNDGSRVTVSGRSILTIADFGQKVLRLRGGNLSADVEPQPRDKPMRIITPSAEAEVLGTQLDLAADAFSTRLTVNEGLVRITRLADGRVQEVPPNYEVVAALEQATAFEALPRRAFSTSWRGSLPEDASCGTWLPYPGGLRAEPLLWKETPEDDPVLLYLTAIRAWSGDTPPPLLGEHTQVRVRGRLAAPRDVVFGLTTHHRKGGFAGKYTTSRLLGTDAEPGDLFEVDLPIGDFKPRKARFPGSPVGLELVDWWGLTVHEDVGLEIVSVELRSVEP